MRKLGRVLVVLMIMLVAMMAVGGQFAGACEDPQISGKPCGG